MAAQAAQYQCISREIGCTPLIPLKRMGSGGLKLYAKLEWYNPFGSLKDRPACWMLREGERRGLLRPGETIVIEPTSGNTGISLTGICRAMGYSVEAVVPDKVSPETKALLKALGAQIFETDDDLCPRVGAGTDQSIALAESIVKARPGRYFMPNQYSNEVNFMAHYETTGPEIWEDTGGKITHFITGVGTGGTVTGASAYLKEQNPNTKVVAVQPQRGHHLQGLRNLEESRMPSLLERRVNLIDEWMTVTDEEAFAAVREAARLENLFLGPSSGATLAAALRVADKVHDGVGVVIFGDDGRKYWSVYSKFGVYMREEFDRLRSGAAYLAKPVFEEALVDSEVK